MQEDGDKLLEIHNVYDESKKLKLILTKNTDKSGIIESDYNKNIEILQETVMEFKNDIRMKDGHYKKWKIIMRDTVDELMEMEQRLLNETKTITYRNKYLKESMRDLTSKMINIDTQLLYKIKLIKQTTA